MSEQIAWGNCLCSARNCAQLAECSVDDIPYCISCADELIERQIAISQVPEFRSTLPPLWEE